MIGLGIDAGGTSTRWALSDASGESIAQGEVGTLSGLMLSFSDGREQFERELVALAAVCAGFVSVDAVMFGLTGAGAGSNAGVAESITCRAFGLNASSVHLRSDMALVHQVHFAPGAGHVLYAGTGSYASFLDARGQLHRVGGRGALLDDAGGGFWIGCEALRAVWRCEESGEDLPRTPLALAVFEQIGSTDWAATRALIYGQDLANSRGGVARLTFAVAQTQSVDAFSAQLLVRAGHELARLASASIRAHGLATLSLDGRVLTELPCVRASCLAAVRKDFPDVQLTSASERLNLPHAAAVLAARGQIYPIMEP